MFEIGNTLREARLRRGLDILDCEAETKIRAKYLRAMEEEQFDLMPSPTYVRGFLRTYAEFLDLDGRLVLDEYESRFTPFYDAPYEPHRSARAPRQSRPEPRRAAPSARPRPPRRRRRRTEMQLLWLAIGGVMTVALLVWLGVGGSDSSPTLPTAPGPAAIGTVTAPVTQPDTASEEGPVRVRKTKVVLTGIGVNGSWVQVRGRDGNGRLVYEGIITPGASQEYGVSRSLWVRAANPAELQVTVDGKPKTLEGGGGVWIISRTKVAPVG
jgi:hypothetical protein